MNISHLSLRIVISALCALSCVDQSLARQWQVGAARLTITPDAPLRLAGYADRQGLARDKLHDLWAKALVLQADDGKSAVLITLDLIGIDREMSASISQRLQDKYDFPRSAIAIVTSHTHTGPVTGRVLAPMYAMNDDEWKQVDRYTDWLEKRILETVDAAWKTREAGMLHCGVGQATFAVNRRNNPESEVVARRAAGKLAGPVDHDVPVLAVRDLNGNLRAVVCGYACHATVLNGVEWSGDWPGFAQIELERRHPDAIALYWAGCGADQNPLPRRSVELAERYGRELADAVDEALTTPMQELSALFSSTYEEIPLPYAELPSHADLIAQAQGTDVVARRAKRLLSIEENGTISPSYPYPVQVWRLGDSLSWIFLGGEAVVDYSIRLKNDVDDTYVFVSAYANDVMAYIPSRRVLTEGGYEGGGAMLYYGLPAAWDVNVEKYVVEAVARLVASIKRASRAQQDSSDR